MLKKRLRPKEVDKKLKELRECYAAFIGEHKKPSQLLSSFNERYYEALKNRKDMAVFFAAEATALKDLKYRELDTPRKPEERKSKAVQGGEKERDSAQKIWEEHRRWISKYPRFGIHPKASEEVDRLLGALIAYREEHWPHLERALRISAPGREGDTLVALEMRWRDICVPRSDGIPPRLWKYRSLLSRIPQNEEALEWEERQIIFEFARFLGLLRNTGGGISHSNSLSEEEKKILFQEQEILETILSDFRLFDLLRLPSSLPTGTSF